MKKLLCWRDFKGMGDWFMSLSALKMLNMQYPDIEIYIKSTVRDAPLSSFLQEMIEKLDVDVKGFVDTKYPRSCKDFDFYSGHMVYPYRNNSRARRGISHKEHYIEGIVNTLNSETGLQIEYDPSVFANYKGEVLFQSTRNYILMPSIGRRDSKIPEKNWGCENFEELAILFLDSGKRTIQIGVHGDPLIPAASRHVMDCSIAELHSLMVYSSLLISLTNYLMCYAGAHNIKQLSIYCGGYNLIAPQRTVYPNQCQLIGNNITPQEVFDCAEKLLA